MEIETLDMNKDKFTFIHNEALSLLHCFEKYIKECNQSLCSDESELLVLRYFQCQLKDKLEISRNSDLIIINFTKDETMVFFEWVFRLNENIESLFFEKETEEQLFFDLECIMEKNIDCIFSSNYTEILDKARTNIKKN